jgi:hypothetical protein
MNTTKQIRLAAAALIGGIVVASSACSTDSLEQSTAPRSLAPSSARLASGTGSAGSSFTDMSKDGTYLVTIDPTVPNTLFMGGSRLDIPASAVCALATSGYGPTFWNLPCVPEARPVQLTITISSSGGEGASVEFFPALRFNPATNVVLTLAAPNVSKQDAKNWIILYCATSTSLSGSNNGSGGSGSGNGTKCVNEALNDKDLQTFVDYDLKQLSRRIKHFSFYSVRSGYLLAE